MLTKQQKKPGRVAGLQGFSPSREAPRKETQMKFKFNLFNLEVQVQSVYLYEAVVFPAETDDPNDYAAGSCYFGRSRLAARISGWQLSRTYAARYRQAHQFVINRYEVDDNGKSIGWTRKVVAVRTIQVRHCVAFFSK